MTTAPKKAVPRLPKTFVPDYGGLPVQQPWYTRPPRLLAFAIAGVAIGFGIGVYRCFF